MASAIDKSLILNECYVWNINFCGCTYYMVNIMITIFIIHIDKTTGVTESRKQ